MHEVRVTLSTGTVLDFRVCTCKIGHDHDQVDGKNIDGRNPVLIPDA